MAKPVPQCEAQSPGVARCQPIEALLQDAIQPAVPRRYPEDLGAQHGGQGQRHETGDDHRARHGNAELIEEPAGRALEKGQGREHRHQRDGGGQHRKGDLPGAVGGRFLRSFVQLLLMPVGVLQHDDRVVHHDPDGQGQGKQGEVVDREAEEIHDGKGRHDRRGDGQAGDDRRPEVPQEEEDDDDHQERRNAQSLLRLLNGALDEDRFIERGVDGHAGWQ